MELNKTAQDWAKALNMIRHVGGGYFVETYRSDESTSDLPQRYGGGSRCFGTAVYFMLEGSDFESFQSIKSDEIRHFYCGKPVSIYLIKTNGDLEIAHLGPGEKYPFQFFVPKNSVFAARLKDPKPGDYALVGATVSPGFEYADHEVLDKIELIKTYPQHEELITSLTH